MKKRFVSCIFALLLSLLLCVSACADLAILSPDAAYLEQDQLCVFINHPLLEELEKDKAPLLKAELANSSLTSLGITQPRKISEAVDEELLVKYVFLIDASSSMDRYKWDIINFAKAVSENTARESLYSIYTFGENLSLIDSELSSDKFLGKIKALNYSQSQTDLVSGLSDLLDSLELQGVKAGELVNIVLISDAILEDANGNSVWDDEQISSLQNRLKGSGSVLLHSYGIKSHRDNTEALSMLGNLGRGYHVSPDESAKDGGRNLAEFVNDTYYIHFNLIKAQNAPFTGRISCFIEENNEQKMLCCINLKDIGGSEIAPAAEAQPEVSPEPETKKPEAPEADSGKAENPEASPLPEKSITDIIPGITTEPDTEKPQDQKPETEKPDTGKPDTGKPDTEKPETGEPDTENPDTENPETEKPDTENPEAENPEAENPDAEGADNDETSEEAPGKKSSSVIIAIVAAVVLIAAAVAAVIIIKKKSPASGSGIYMKLELNSGTYRGKRTDFRLNDQLLIGSGKKCDIIFADPDVAELNSRIFINDGFIFIEDLNSPSGTYLGGMRIYDPNRLRSGDIISIGDVSFSLLF